MGAVEAWLRLLLSRNEYTTHNWLRRHEAANHACGTEPVMLQLLCHAHCQRRQQQVVGVVKRAERRAFQPSRHYHPIQLVCNQGSSLSVPRAGRQCTGEAGKTSRYVDAAMCRATCETGNMGGRRRTDVCNLRQPLLTEKDIGGLEVAVHQRRGLRRVVWGEGKASAAGSYGGVGYVCKVRRNSTCESTGERHVQK